MCCLALLIIATEGEYSELGRWHKLVHRRIAILGEISNSGNGCTCSTTYFVCICSLRP